MPQGQSEGTNMRYQPRLGDSQREADRERNKERERERERENYPVKSSNLRHCQACSQNKGLSRASQLWTGPSPVGDRHAGAARAGRGQSWLRSFIANQDFLGFWMVDIHQEGHSQRSAPQKRHTAHLRRCTDSAPRKLSG